VDLSGVAAVVLVGLFGLAFGSFLTVVIHRVPRGESVVQPGSRCPECRTPLAPYDNIPVASWLALGGRCRTCHEPIPIRYVLAELGTATMFVVVALRLGVDADLPGLLGVFFLLTAAAVIEWRSGQVPLRVASDAGAAAVFAFVLAAAVDQDWSRLGRGLVGSAASGAGVWLALCAARKLDAAAVVLGALSGLALAWAGWRNLAVGAATALLVVGAGRLARSRRPHSADPGMRGGPAAAVGVGLVVGTLVLHWS